MSVHAPTQGTHQRKARQGYPKRPRRDGKATRQGKGGGGTEKVGEDHDAERADGAAKLELDMRVNLCGVAREKIG